MDDKKFLALAIEQAQNSVDEGGFPAGAIVVKDGKVIAEGVSTGFILRDPSAHGDSMAIRAACRDLATSDLAGATLYGSMESCTMCFSTAYWAGITRIVYAARKTPELIAKSYYEGPTLNQDLNETNNRKIELVHIPELEQEVLDVIAGWEKAGGFKRQ